MPSVKRYSAAHHSPLKRFWDQLEIKLGISQRQAHPNVPKLQKNSPQKRLFKTKRCPNSMIEEAQNTATPK